MNSAIERLVASRASADSEYRKAMLLDPITTLREYHNIDLPAGIKVRVLEEMEDEMILKIPPVAIPDPHSIDIDEVDSAAGLNDSYCSEHTCSSTCGCESLAQFREG